MQEFFFDKIKYRDCNWVKKKHENATARLFTDNKGDFLGVKL
jgi:hypothetical protein